MYAQRRLPSLAPQLLALLVGRAGAAAGVVIVVITPLRARIAMPPSLLGRLLLLFGGAVTAVAVFAGLLFLLGYRWRRLSQLGDEGMAV